MAILYLLYRCYRSVSVEIQAGKLNVLLWDPPHAYFNRLFSVKQDCRIQNHTTLFVAVWRGIGPAAAPVHTDRKLHHYLVLCDLILVHLIHITCLENFLLENREAFLLDLIIADSVECFLHEFHGAGNVIQDTDFLRKFQLLVCQLHQQVKLFLIDFSCTKGFQCVHVIFSCLHSSKKTFCKDAVLQLLAPRNEYRGIRQPEGLFQGVTSLFPPVLYLLTVSPSLAHLIKKQRPGNCLVQAFLLRVKSGLP